MHLLSLWVAEVVEVILHILLFAAIVAVRESRLVLDRPAVDPCAHVERRGLLEDALFRERCTVLLELRQQSIEPVLLDLHLSEGHFPVHVQSGVHSERTEDQTLHAGDSTLPHAALHQLTELTVEALAGVLDVTLWPFKVLGQQVAVDVLGEHALLPERFDPVDLVRTAIQRGNLIERWVRVLLVAQQVVTVRCTVHTPTALEELEDFGPLLVQHPVQFIPGVVCYQQPHIIRDLEPTFCFLSTVEVLAVTGAAVRLLIDCPANHHNIVVRVARRRNSTVVRVVVRLQIQHHYLVGFLYFRHRLCSGQFTDTGLVRT